jgi:ABC-type dipeptide/oligopeptide/nickel transport system permease component
LLLVPVIVLIVTTILFSLLLQLPVEQRAQVYMPAMRTSATREQEAEVLRRVVQRYGLDKPIPIQYANWLGQLLRGQWGYSPSWNQPVLTGLWQRAPASAELVLAATIPSVILSLTLGTLSARYQGQVQDHAIRFAAFVGWAFPPFILGLLLMNVLYAWLGWFPPERLSGWARVAVEGEGFSRYTGMHTVDALLNGNLGVFWDAVRHLVLPAVTLAMTQWGLMSRVMRSSLLETLGQDYVVTARAKGLRERQVVRVHARRNAVLPVISIGGVLTSLLLSQLVVVETIFAFNGIGRAAIQAILLSDIPGVAGFAVFSCLVTIVVSLVADLLYAVVDPRVRS